VNPALSRRRARPPRRVVLFVLALILPALAIVALGVRLIGQERELAATRAADERRRIVAEARQAFTHRLAHVRARETARHAGQDLGGSPADEVVLARTGRAAQADEIDLALAVTPLDVTDEYGMPLALYAAQRLSARGLPLPAAFLESSAAAMQPGRWPSPTACYAMQELAARRSQAADPSLRAWAGAVASLASERAANAERLLATDADLAALLPRVGAAVDHWTFIPGEPPWLLGAATLRGGETLVIAIDADRLPASLMPVAGAADLALAGHGDAGEPLGESFPGARLVFTPLASPGSADRARLQFWFYAAALVLVLAATGAGTFVLWRDVRREIRLGALRAQFVASVSHELKTPLTAIRMFAETLRMGRGMDEASRAEYLDTIVNESERLTRLLNNVLDFSRIDQAQKTYRFAPTDLADVIRTAARTVEYPLAQGRFELRMQLAADVPAVQADADAVQQAVLNLLTNAMKYSGMSRHLEVTLARQDDHAVISVTDHGVGIAPADRPRLFDRFYRAPTAENQHIAGTGLGLTIVQHIAEAHGGRVDVQSVPQAGSTFSLLLPLGPAASPSPVAEVHA
jgi:signal transduction histidine kinase